MVFSTVATVRHGIAEVLGAVQLHSSRASRHNRSTSSSESIERDWKGIVGAELVQLSLRHASHLVEAPRQATGEDFSRASSAVALARDAERSHAQGASA
jgi:hypothetical protein